MSNLSDAELKVIGTVAAQAAVKQVLEGVGCNSLEELKQKLAAIPTTPSTTGTALNIDDLKKMIEQPEVLMVIVNAAAKNPDAMKTIARGFGNNPEAAASLNIALNSEKRAWKNELRENALKALKPAFESYFTDNFASAADIPSKADRLAIAAYDDGIFMGVSGADQANPDKVRELINAWVAKKLDEMKATINDQLTPGGKRATKLVETTATKLLLGNVLNPANAEAIRAELSQLEDFNSKLK